MDKKITKKLNSIHIREIDLEEFKNLFPKDDLEVVSLLPWLRELVSKNPDYLDALIYADFQPEIFNRRTKMSCIYYNITDSNQFYIDNSEPDIVMFSLFFGQDKKYNYREILLYALGIMLSDCTGCCDALDYVNLSRYGILAYGNVSMTYHS